MKNRWIGTLLTLGILLSGLLVPMPVSAATLITVTTTADGIAVDNQCSLREAVIAANTNSTSGDCAAGSAADTIVFSSSLPTPAIFKLTILGSGENNAATGDLDLQGALTIQGAGRDQTIIDGNGIDRVFEVRPSANVVISGVTVRNGKPGAAEAGAGILSVGRLNLSDSLVSSNLGDGIVNNGGLAALKNVTVKDNLGGYGILNEAQGSLTFTGGEVSGNQHGGVYNTIATAILTNINVLNNTGAGGVANVGSATSRLTVSGSVVKFNSSTTNGGGIRNDGAQNIADVSTSTISSNQAANAGGGVFNFGSLSLTGNTIENNQARTGGGIDHFNGAFSMTNDTVSGNAASDNGGGLYNRNNSTLVNVTFSGNTASGQNTGGNIFNESAPLSIKNSIVANSEADGNCFYSGGSINSQGHNLDSGNTCGFTASGDLVNTNPMLGALGNNGGPTFTQALLSGSPAIDQADNAGCPKTDQRGYARPADGDANGTATCDMGAYELNGAAPTATPVPPTATSTTTPKPTATFTPSATLKATNTLPPTATVQVTETFTPAPTTPAVDTDTPTPTLEPTSTGTPTAVVTAVTSTPAPSPTPAPGPIPPCSSAALVLGLLFLSMRLRVK